MTFVSYSQNLEDVMLWRALRDVPNGFYIDVGAWDPREDSVTLSFYERGWHGINVEPNADKHRLLAQSRTSDINLAVALGREPGMRMFYDVPGTGLSTLDPVIAERHRASGHEVHERPVAVWTLRDLCAAHAPPDIHFLKIDVEGLEADVLAGGDFQRVRPWIVVVEATAPNSPEPTHGEWEPGLLDAGYALAYRDGLNRYYVADERARTLLPAFDRPPNVFDNYVSAAGIRKAIQSQQAGFAVRELQDVPNERHAAATEALRAEVQAAQAAADAAAAQAAALAEQVREAQAAATEAAKAAELRALHAEREAALLRADREHADLPIPAKPAPAAPAAPEVRSAQRQRLYYDASLVVHHGMETPVGLIRTEHYVAEYLARDPALDVHFVRYDSTIGGFRALRRDEATLLWRVLFHRYDEAASAPELRDGLQATGTDPGGVTLAHEPELADLPDPQPLRRVKARLLARKVRTAVRLDPRMFDHMLVHYAVRYMPVTPQQGPVRRFAVRSARRLGLHAARGVHAVAHGAATAVGGAVGSVLDAGRHLLRPDTLHAREPALMDAPAFQAKAAPRVLAHPPRPTTELQPESPPCSVQFEVGAVLLSMGNSWDYLDYGYLHALVKHHGLRFVSVVFDVIAMQYPFTTPGPPHIYHRHWVEIGHSASHLLAISKFTVDQYAQYISGPNDLSPPMSYAYLPSFLLARAGEIGEAPVPKLLGKQFAMFCSTIEIRKNHQLLLHAWDRLLDEVPAAELPTLVFVGKWGWGTETVRLLCERNPRLRPHLLILDKVNDAELIWLYRNARFGLFPAMSEGYGLAAAESLSFGTPVVISSCPALVEATEGLMPAYDPLDIQAWMAELRRLVCGEERLHELRQAAQQYRGPGYADFAEAMRAIAQSMAPAAPVPARAPDHADAGA